VQLRNRLESNESVSRSSGRDFECGGADIHDGWCSDLLVPVSRERTACCGGMAGAVSVMVAVAALLTVAVWVTVLLAWLSGRERRASLGRRCWVVRLAAFLGFIADERFDRMADASPTRDVVIMRRLDPVPKLPVEAPSHRHPTSPHPLPRPSRSAPSCRGHIDGHATRASSIAAEYMKDAGENPNYIEGLTVVPSVPSARRDFDSAGRSANYGVGLDRYVVVGIRRDRATPVG
jgi:hypothetical protein